jgi:hypothetical protein
MKVRARLLKFMNLSAGSEGLGETLCDITILPVSSSSPCIRCLTSMPFVWDSVDRQRLFEVRAHFSFNKTPSSASSKKKIGSNSNRQLMGLRFIYNVWSVIYVSELFFVPLLMSPAFDIPDATGLVIAARAGSSSSDTWYSESMDNHKDSAGLDGSVNTAHDYDTEHGQSHSARHYEVPHQSVGFWHHRLSKVRAHVLLLWAKTGKSNIYYSNHSFKLHQADALS